MLRSDHREHGTEKQLGKVRVLVVGGVGGGDDGDDDDGGWVVYRAKTIKSLALAELQEQSLSIITH